MNLQKKKSSFLKVPKKKSPSNHTIKSLVMTPNLAHTQVKTKYL